MSNIDNKYIKALNDFTHALGAVVDTLNGQQKAGKSDTVNEMLKNMPDQLNIVIEDLKKIKTDTDSIKSNTDVILQEIKSIKQSKESGMFDKVEDPKNKNKIVDGIKVVILIAAGVLAMGLAFKLIGKVDYVSVLALSAGISIMAIAFSIFYDKLKGVSIVKMLLLTGLLIAISYAVVKSSNLLAKSSFIDQKIMGSIIFTSLIIGASLSLLVKTVENMKISFKSIVGLFILVYLAPIVAEAIVKSSNILKNTSTIEFGTMVAVTFTSLAIGTSLFILTKAFEHIKLRSIIGLLLLPFIAPMIARVIVKSSNILKDTAVIDFKTMIGITLTSIAIGIALYAITTAIGRMNKTTAVLAILTKGAIFGLIVAAIAGGIVLASTYFGQITPVTLMQGVTAIFVAVTLGIVLFAVSKLVQYTEGMSISKAIAIGALMYVISWSIKKTSEILSHVPVFSFSFALKLVVTAVAIGIAIYVFAFAWKKLATSLVNIDTSGVHVGKPSESKTVKTIVSVAISIVLASQILRMGKYDGNYPDYRWSLGVGLSLVEFGAAVSALGWVVKKVGEKNMAYGALFAVAVAGVIFVSSWLLSLGKYENAPSYDWTLHVGLSLVAFGSTMAALGFVVQSIRPENLAWGALATLSISFVIALSSGILSKGKYEEGSYPKVEWSAGVGLSLIVFGGVMAAAGALMEGSIGTGFIVLGLGAAAILIIAATIVATSYILGVGKYENYPKLEWLAGVGLSITAFSVMGPIALIGAVFGLAIPAVAGIIVWTSNILAKGNYKDGPSFEWAKGVGLLIVAFSTSAALLGIIAVSGFGLGALALVAGLASMIAVAEIIKKVSFTLAGGNYKGGPTLEWADGIGTAITAFASAISDMGDATSGIMSIFSGPDVKQMNGVITAVIDGMVAANKSLGNDIKWSENYPSKDWAEGVGTAVTKFAEAARSLYGGSFQTSLSETALYDPNPVDGKNRSLFVVIVDTLMSGLFEAAKKITGSNIDWWSLDYPNPDWVTNIGSSLESLLKLSRILRGEGSSGKNITSIFQTTVSTLMDALISVGTKFSLAPANLIKWDKLIAPSSDFMNNFYDSVTIMIKTVKYFKAEDVDLDNMTDFVSGIGTLLPVLVSVAQSTQSPLNELFIQNFEKLVIQLCKFPDKSREIRNLAGAFRELSDSLKTMTPFNNLTKVSAGLVLLTAVDDVKLQIVLDKIKENADTLKTVFGSNDSLITSIFSTAGNSVDDIMKAINVEKSENIGKTTKSSNDQLFITSDSPKQTDELTKDVNDIKRMFSELLELKRFPSGVGSFDD